MWRSDEGLKNYIVSLLLSVALYLSLVWLILTLFSVEIPFLFSFGVGLVVILTGCAAPILKQREWVVPMIWILLILLAALIFWNRSMDGLATLMNRVIDTYKQVKVENYEVYAVSENQWNLYLAIAEGAALLALGCVKVIKRHSVCVGLAVIVGLVALSLIFLPVITNVWLAVAAFTVVFVWFISVIYRKQAVSAGTKWIACKTCLRTAVIFLVFLTVLCSIAAPDRKPDMVQDIARKVSEWCDARRYGSTFGTGLIEGDLSKAGKRQTNTRTMLRVTMSEPTSYYLRGFVGEKYEKNRWTELSQKVLYENSATFYWLHQSGFYAQSQIAAAASVTEENMIRYENDVYIENLGLPSDYLYAPYELMPWSGILNKKAVGDSTIYAEGIPGQREYRFTAADNLIVQYQSLAAMLSRNQEEGGAADFLKNEAAYNRYVYEQYISVPSDIHAYLGKELGNYVVEDGQIHFDYQKAKQNILYYLTKTVTYSEDVAPVEKNVDFILNFLDGTQSGYSVHYASAAVMMFRYYGIPARYTEGYIVTKEDVKNTKAGETLDLDSTHAHAWAEYYQDGVGWLPFEVTPTYLSVMEQADTYKDISGLIGQAPENETLEVMQPETLNEEENPTLMSFWLKNRLTILLVLSILLLALLLFLFAAWLVSERRKTARRKRGFLTENLRSAICDIFSYITDVMVASGLETDNRPPEEYADFFDEDLRVNYRNVVSIWQEAKFSSNEMTEKQRETVLTLKDELWKRTWKASGPVKKLQLKFMYFL